ARLAQEQRARRRRAVRVGAGIGAQELERDLAVERRVAHAVDHPHAADPEHLDHLEPPDPVAARPLVRLGAGQLGDDLPAGRAAVGVALDRLALRPVEAAAHQLDEALVIRAWSGTGRHPATLYTGRVGMSETE